MTANGLISQALGLQISYFVLDKKSKYISSIEIDRKVLIHTGLRQSAIIILSFAIEIALKGLLKFRINSFPKTHDLKKLFERLDENDRIQLSKIHKQNTNFDIADCLSKHKNTFMAFRYLETNIEEPIYTEQLDAVINSIIYYYNEINGKSKQFFFTTIAIISTGLGA